MERSDVVLAVSLSSQWLSQVSLATSVSLCLTIQAKQRPNKQRIVSRTDQASFVHLSLPAPPPPVDQSEAEDECSEGGGGQPGLLDQHQAVVGWWWAADRH